MSGADISLLRYPKRFASWALGRSFGEALACVAIAMGFSTLAAYRLANTVRVDDLVFGPTRSETIDALIKSIGVERTTVLVYMLQRSFDTLVIASAFTPIFFWLLASSAMHAAARLRDVRGHPYLPILVLFAFAALIYQVATSASYLLLAPLGPSGTQLANALSLGAFIWFALVAYRGVEQHYGVAGDQALAIFLIGGVVFYLLPLILIVGALIAIVLAAALLQYF